MSLLVDGIAFIFLLYTVHAIVQYVNTSVVANINFFPFFPGQQRDLARLSTPREELYTLITGCDTGFGRLLVEALANENKPVLAGCLTETGVKVLESSGRPNLIPFLLDVTNPADLERCQKLIQSVCPEGLGAVVNNAGISQGYLVEWSTMEEARQVLEVNFLAPLAMIKMCLPFLRRTRGRIINISSASSIIPIPGLSLYSASKSALSAMTQALRQETKHMGVAVCEVVPGFAYTNLISRITAMITEKRGTVCKEIQGAYPENRIERSLAFFNGSYRRSMSPDFVVQAIQHALFSRFPKVKYQVGKEIPLIRMLKALPEVAYEAVWALY
ncbi:hypothetical protein H696_01878 [Fonticula alba]|uniref:Uncharacterized protein n=1 Tax=Fonticula alba TaxID=691883 RepID=A0A058ZBX9_FONAL|nr:hypothetical protein H696_01878 [Fonticula alba]KCV70932.1 hypothetical protein H696_01878 [Fonticula alba]|eukprot:XP_009494055.1 hypothetical protein H696_01878 [Fonticula alba]